MAERTTNIKIGVLIDKAATRASASELRNFFTASNQTQRLSAREQNKIVADAAKEQAKVQTVLTREGLKQHELMLASARKVAEAETRTKQAEYNKQKRDIDARARYEYSTGLKSKNDYVQFLKDEEAAEKQSYARRNQLVRQRQQLEKQGRPSVSGAVAGGALAGASAFGSAAAIRGTIDYADRVATLASDLVETRSKAAQVFKQNANDVDQWAKNAVKSMGLTRQEAIEGASTFGMLFRVTKQSDKAVADMSTRTVQLAADITSFSNVKDVNQVLADLRSGLNGEAEPLRKFGIYLSEDRVKAEAFAAGLAKPVKDGPAISRAHEQVEIAAAKAAQATRKFGEGSIEAASANLALDKANASLAKAMQGSTKELTDQQKVQARYNLILKDTTTQQGDYARTAQDAANKQRSLNKEFVEMETALGEKLLPLKKQVLEFLTQLLDKYNGLSDATKSFVVSTVGIGSVAIPLAAGVTNIVAQLLRIKAAYAAIKTEQAAAALLSGTPGAPVAKSAAAGLFGRFAPAVGGALVSTLPITAPLLIAGGAAYLGAKSSIGQSEQEIANTQLATRERIKLLRGQSGTYQSQINQIKGVATSPTDPYAAKIQGDLLADLTKKKAEADKEITLLGNQLMREAKYAKAQRERLVKAAANQSRNDAKADGTADPGQKTVPGLGGLYSGAARNAAVKQAEADAKKQASVAKRIDAGSDKIALNWFLLINKAADKQRADTARFLKETQDLWDKGSKAIAEANYTEAKNALETSDDPKRIQELAKIIRDRIMEIYNAELTHLDAQFDRDIKPQAGESPARRAAREGAVNARRNEGYNEANRKRDTELGQLNKQVQSATGKADEKRVRQNEQAMRSRDEFLAAEHRILERQIRDADKTHDYELEKLLINQQMVNEMDTARRTFFEGYLSGDTSKISEGNAKFVDAQDKASDALRDLAARIQDRIAAMGPFNEPRLDRLRQYDTGARGSDRFFTDRNGLTYDRKNTANDGDLKRVDGAAIAAAAALTDAAKRDGGEFFRALISGDKGKDALKNLGKNIGRDFAQTGADFLQRKLIDGPMDKLFDNWADKLEGGLKSGGKEAGGNIAGAAMLLMSAGNILGKNGKKKQRNTILGAALGLGVASVLPGVGNLAGLGFGSVLGGMFAKGGIPPLGRRVGVGEYGPELSVGASGRATLVGEYRPQIATFNEPTRIFSAEDTARMMNGRGGGGDTHNHYSGPLATISIDRVEDKADVNRMMDSLTYALS